MREAAPLPVLCKDFVVDPYQVTEARAHGADAILLMLSVVDDATYRACHQVADALSVDVLTEVHDDGELRRAVDLGAKIVGINNRDLSTLEVDLATLPSRCEAFNIFGDLPHRKFSNEKAKRLLGFAPRDRFEKAWHKK